MHPVQNKYNLYLLHIDVYSVKYTIYIFANVRAHRRRFSLCVRICCFSRKACRICKQLKSKSSIDIIPFYLAVSWWCFLLYSLHALLSVRSFSDTHLIAVVKLVPLNLFSLVFITDLHWMGSECVYLCSSVTKMYTFIFHFFDLFYFTSFTCFTHFHLKLTFVKIQ